MHPRLIIVPVLFLATLAASQGTPTAPAKPSPEQPAAQKAPDAKPAARAQIPADAPVITIKCATAQPASDCNTVVTRAQFEALVNALNPDMPENVRQSFAQNYGKLLVIAAEAKRAGIANTPETALLYDFAKLQVLAQELGKRLQKSSNEIPQSEIEAYYKEHAADYRAADLQRIIVPRATASQEKPVVNEADEKAYADKVRAQWVAGGDPVKLQEAAFAHSGNKQSTTPGVDLGERRRNSLPPNQAAVLDLKPGEISQPFAESSAFFIYKVKSVETQPLAKAQDEIRKLLSSQKLQSEMERVTKSGEASLNETYFGTPEPSPTPASAPAPRPAAPVKAAAPAAKSVPAGKSAPAASKPASTNPK